MTNPQKNKALCAAILQSRGCLWQIQTFVLRSDNTSLASAQQKIHSHCIKEVCFSKDGLIPFMPSVATPPSHRRLIVEDFSFEIPQAALQVGAGFWLQGLGELDVIRTADLRLPLDGVLDGLWGEVVNNGIKAAVGHSYAEGYWVDHSDHRLCKAAF